MERVPMTIEGFKTLESELQRLKSEERPRIIQQIAEARAHGDLSENAEYHAAKEAQGFNEARVAELEDRIGRADVIDTSKLSGNTVKFGATVTLVDEDTDEKVKYKIVGDFEANVREGKISISSPIARALIGKSKNDTAEVTTPKGARSYQILKIEWKYGAPARHHPRTWSEDDTLRVSLLRNRNRHARLALGAADGEERFHARHVGCGGEHRQHELLECGELGRHALEHVVALARQHVGLAHQLPAQHQVLELAQLRLRLVVEPHHGKCRELEAERRLVEQHRIAGDQTGFLQRAHAAQARRRRKADARGQRDVGHASVALKLLEDAPVERIEADGHRTVFR